jgi:hypothetical protein
MSYAQGSYEQKCKANLEKLKSALRRHTDRQQQYTALTTAPRNAELDGLDWDNPAHLTRDTRSAAVAVQSWGAELHARVFMMHLGESPGDVGTCVSKGVADILGPVETQAYNSVTVMFCCRLGRCHGQ